MSDPPSDQSQQSTASADGGAQSAGSRAAARHRTVTSVLQESELPPSICAVIERTVSRARLWPAERIDVACELIAHFHDGLDAGQSPKQLVSNFGDAERVAKLIRRAKRRNRPVWWRATRRSFQSIALVIAVLIVFYLGLTIRYYTGEPTIRRDYVEPLNAVPASVPAEDRAWPKYRAALAPLEANQTLSELRGFGPEHERWSELRTELRHHADDLAHLREAASMPGLGFIASSTLDAEDRAFFGIDKSAEADQPDGGLFGVRLSHLSTLRSAAQVLASDARLAAAEGDGARASANVIAMLGIAAHSDEHPTLINQLVTFAIMSLVFDTFKDMLAESPSIFPDDELQGIAHTIVATTGAGAIRIDLSGERMFFEDFIQRIYTDDGRGGGRFTPRGLQLLNEMQTIGVPEEHAELAGDDDSLIEEAKQFLIGPALAVVMADRREMMRRYNEIFTAIEREMAVPLWRAEFKAEHALNELMGSGPILRARYLIVALLMPAIRRSGVTAEMATQRRDAAQAAIALELYRRRYGDWPEVLAELAPNLLPRVPVDRFDGRPLRYVVRDGRAVLYSIGTNRVDNGGVPALGRDGEPQPNATARWIPADQVDYHPNVPDGDWILWQSR